MTQPSANPKEREMIKRQDILARASWARVQNAGKPKPAWSTGERLIVALVLDDRAYLAAEGYTEAQAYERLAGDLMDSPYEARVWVRGIRDELIDRADQEDSERLAAMGADVPVVNGLPCEECGELHNNRVDAENCAQEDREEADDAGATR